MVRVFSIHEPLSAAFVIPSEGAPNGARQTRGICRASRSRQSGDGCPTRPSFGRVGLFASTRKEDSSDASYKPFLGLCDHLYCSVSSAKSVVASPSLSFLSAIHHSLSTKIEPMGSLKG